MASHEAGERLDVWLAGRLPELSRSRIQSLIRTAGITANGRQVRPHCKVAGGWEIAVEIPPAVPAEPAPENIPLDIIHEDADIIVINKLAGLVVHPAAGHASGTLVNALLHHCKDLAGIGGQMRPGLVHRLDRDTSGVMVVAKNEKAMIRLARQFKNRRVSKEYAAVVYGVPEPAEGRIETLVGRSSRDRKKMSATPAAGRISITNYSVAEAFSGAALVRLKPETGRMHQIRVHMAHIGHPVIGDSQYGGRHARNNRDVTAARQMLHAEVLAFRHPADQRKVEFRAPLPDDMISLLTRLRRRSS